MTPRLSVIAASIRRVFSNLAGDIGTYADEYWNSVVLALRGNTASDPFWANTSLLMHTDEADANWGDVVLGMHMGGGEVDPYWSSVSLLMLMNGTNNSTAIGDVTGKTVTVNGNASISTTQSKFGGASCYFDGTGDYLTAPHSTDLSLAGGDFTIEAWIRPASVSIQQNIVAKQATLATATGYLLYMTSSGVITFVAGDSSAGWDVTVTGSTLTINTWYHVAVTRAGTLFTLFVNGVPIGSATSSITIHDAANSLYIGSNTDGSTYQYNGYIDNLRITKGIARYTDTFDPPRKEFPAGATTIYDVKGHPVTVNGNTSIVATQSRFGGYSCYFDGSGDYVTSNSTEFDIAQGNFTFEAWIYPIRATSTGTTSTIAHFNAGSTSGLHINRLDTGYLQVDNGATGTTPGNIIIPLNVWTHIAVVRSSGVITGYVNGSSCLTHTAQSYAAATVMSIGRYAAGVQTGDFQGYIDDVRVSKTLARYTATFTPPSRAFPHDLPFVDEKGKYPVVTGTPSISTTTPKFGGATASFNGTTDYLTFDAHADFGLGTGDYTVEGWIKTSAVGTLLDTRNYAADYGLFYIATGGYLAHDHTYGALVGTISVTDNTWHHVAFVRYSNVLTMYVDGKDSGAYVSNANLGSLRQARIGAKVDGTSFYSGLMDEIRVTKGVARYVSEFTPQAYSIADSNNNLLLQDETGTKVITSYGNAGVSTTQIKYGNGALYFDGTGDYLQSTSSDYVFGTGDFTVEFWMYLTAATGDWIGLFSIANANIMYIRFPNHGSGSNIEFSLNEQSSWSNVYGGNAIETSFVNTWRHVALTRQSGNVRFFIDGVRQGIGASGADNGTAEFVTLAGNLTSNVLNLGSNGFYGYLDDIRITKGVARYLSTFTPPARENANYGKPTRYDPYWDAVVLGMHMDDTGLTDVKSHTVTLSGTAARSATQSKFGGYSAVVAGSTGYVSVADSADFALGSVFTIELWVYQTAYANASNYNSLIGQRAVGANAWFIQLFAGQGGMYGPSFQINNSGGTALLTVNPPTNTTYNPTLNTWHHIAVTCDGTTARVFFNGLVAGSAAFTGSIVDCASALTIGYLPQYTENCTGYIDDVRITRGVARYTAAFQPAQYAFPETRLPVKTYVDPYYDDVVLNMHFNGPSGSAAFVDEKGNTVTAYGNASLSTTQSKFGGVSGYFDGTGDYLTLSPLITTGDYTFECWVYLTAYDSANGNVIFSQGVTGDAGRTQLLVGAISPTLTLQIGSLLISGSTSVAVNTWHHVALTLSGTTARIFLNGNLEATGTSPATIGGTAFRIGQNWVTNAEWTGYIDDLRVTQGTARYTAPFTVPALPNPDYKTVPAATDPHWKNVVLHMPMNGADGGTTFTENTGKTVTVVGNTSTQVEQYRFGGSSAYFDGTGDYLSASATSFAFGTADFTVECFVNPANVTNSGVWQLSSTVGGFATTNRGCVMAFNSGGGGLSVSYGGTDTFVTATIPTNTWTHLAMTRSGTSLKVFVNGVVMATFTDTANYSGQYLIIGGYYSTSYLLNGYIDDVRITNGVARYTAAFTPPSLPNPTGYDPYAPNVVLHLPMNTDFTDGTGKTVTVNNAVISTTQKKFGAGSGYFDGAGDYLRFAASADWLFVSTENFTLECWAMLTADAAQAGGVRYALLMGVGPGPGAVYMMFYITGDASTTGTGLHFTNGTNQLTVTGTVTKNVWHHFAVSRSGGAVRFFLDGVQMGTDQTGYTYAVGSNAQPLNIAGQPNGSGYDYWFPGYIDDLRITKGVARYTANFVPPKEPFSLT